MGKTGGSIRRKSTALGENGVALWVPDYNYSEEELQEKLIEYE